LLPTEYDRDLVSLDPLLWATVDPNGDRTANVLACRSRREAVRNGATKLVRITLPARGFLTWKGLKRRRLRLAQEQQANGFDIDPDDVHEEFTAYEFSAYLFGQYATETWRVHPCPFPFYGVPIRRALAIEAWSGNCWRSNPEIRSPIRMRRGRK
jgi:hypothetical protein